MMVDCEGAESRGVVDQWWNNVAVYCVIAQLTPVWISVPFRLYRSPICLKFRFPRVNSWHWIFGTDMVELCFLAVGAIRRDTSIGDRVSVRQHKGSNIYVDGFFARLQSVGKSIIESEGVVVCKVPWYAHATYGVGVGAARICHPVQGQRQR